LTVTGPTSRAPRRLRTTSAIALTAQFISSVTNFLAMLLAARAGTAEQFGAVAIAFGVYLVVAVVIRSLVCEPLIIRHQNDKVVLTQRLPGWAGALIVVPLALLSGLAALLSDSSLRWPLAALSACLPLLIWQDVERYQQFAMARPERVALYDGSWLALFAGLYVLAERRGTTPEQIWIIWCVAGATVGAMLLIAHHGKPRWSSAREWLRVNKDLSIPLLVDNAAAVITANVSLVLLAVMLGRDATGVVRAAISLFGGLTVMYLGLYSTLVGVAQRSIELRHKVAAWSTAVLLVSALATTGAFAALPTRFGQRLLGELWLPVRSVLWPYGFAVLMSVSSTGAQITLRALGHSGHIVRARALATPVALVVPLIGAAVGGVDGYCIGLGLASAFGSALLWRSTRVVSTTTHTSQEFVQSPS
jgi:O-antigen/teichoic acid export membrane protein